MEKTVISIFAEDPAVRAALAEALRSDGQSGAAQVVPGGDSGVRVEAQMFPAPVRIGAVLDYVRGLQKNPARAALVFGPYTLDEAGQSLQRGADVVRLTEKETHILKMLAAAAGGIVRKEELLNAVWNYADGVETHTLETHIYRLRQKIERDPAKPEILITEEPGYRLGV
jgi:DNA-binding response OmpR family regulator